MPLKIIKRYIIIPFLLLTSILIFENTIWGKQITKKQVPSLDTIQASKLNRVPVTFLFHCKEEKYTKIFMNIVDSLYESNGIISNKIDLKRIQLSDDIEIDLERYLNDAPFHIKNEIENKKVINKIIGVRYNHNADGTFDFNRIRKVLQLNNEELIVPDCNFTTSKILQNLGELIMDNSYIIVFDLLDNNDNETSFHKKNNILTVRAYLYKINFNHSVAIDFYQNLWFDLDDSISYAQNRIKKFDNYPFKVSYIEKFELNKNSKKELYSNINKNNNFSLESLLKKSINELLHQIYIKPYGTNNSQIIINQFPLFTPNLKQVKFNSPSKTFIDQNYNVFKLNKSIISARYVDDRDSSSIFKIDTICKLKKVADIKLTKTNDKNNTTYYFNQISGKKLNDSYLLKPIKEHIGLGLAGGYGYSILNESNQNQSPILFGNGGYIFLRGELNISRISSKYWGIQIPTSIHLFCEGNYSEYRYNHYAYNVAKSMSTINGHPTYPIYLDLIELGFKETFNISKTTLKYGLSKDVHFARNFYYTFFISHGISSIKYRGIKIEESNLKIIENYNMLINFPLELNEDGSFFTYKIDDNDEISNQQEIFAGIRFSMIIGFNLHLQSSIEGGVINNSWQHNSSLLFPEMNFMASSDIRTNISLKYQF